jgi:GMP synthase-like glutamine amidotransferase
MHVLVIQHVEREGSAAIGDAIRARGLEERVVRIHRGDPVPRELEGARGLLVMGGPMGVYEADRLPHLRDEMRLLARAVDSGVPVLGVCLGSELLAGALGADVRPAPAREIGWREVQLREGAGDDALWGGVPRVFTPLHWHGDVFDLPRGAVPLASSEQTEHQAFRVGDNAWGVLFHMEMRPAEVAGMADTFAEDLASVGLRREDVVAPADARVAAVAPIAQHVFSRWASRISG